MGPIAILYLYPAIYSPRQKWESPGYRYRAKDRANRAIRIGLGRGIGLRIGQRAIRIGLGRGIGYFYVFGQYV